MVLQHHCNTISRTINDLLLEFKNKNGTIAVGEFGFAFDGDSGSDPFKTGFLFLIEFMKYTSSEGGWIYEK